ncbi:hypothetical protein ACSAZL_07165 [Methanosarcina sp. T3]|uniref:hypothetical protein n=1 Tax=Methanosarcina sp. T3 TaxID=3439062 RepID=UPI003F83DA0F
MPTVIPVRAIRPSSNLPTPTVYGKASVRLPASVRFPSIAPDQPANRISSKAASCGFP